MPGAVVLLAAFSCREQELKSQESQPGRVGRGEKLRGCPTHSGLITEALDDSQKHLDSVVVRETGSDVGLVSRPASQ